MKRYLGLLFLTVQIIHVNGQTAVSGDGSIHALGNGAMCIYEKGADIITAYTGPFSTPSYFTLQCSGGTEIQSSRKQGTALWTHTLLQGNTATGVLDDLVDAKLPCFVRHVETKSRVVFQMKLEPYVQVIDNSNRLSGHGGVSGRLMIVPPGTTIYQTYVYPRLLYGQLMVTGASAIESVPDSGIIRVTCEPGTSDLYIIGGPEYADVMSHTSEILKTSREKMMEETLGYWKNFTKSRKDFGILLPASVPQREKLLQTIDDVAVLIKSQQSVQGAVLAGYPYPLGYVRDQYGVSRGLLALGLTGEARSILNFYWKIFKRYGYIHNAQAIGVDGIFHIHENDEVESPGYLIMQSFDLLKASHDTAFMQEISPMLDWAYTCQKKYLVNGMLPFNGDETYVAGGLLPRSALNDGSAEATMLFVESGQKYLDWAERTHRMSTADIGENRSLVALVKSKFQDNFWHDGVLWTNNPERATIATLPQYRHGVCEKAGDGCLMNKYQGIVWTERNENNRYLCAACINAGPFPKADPKAYNLLSVALDPFYMKFTVMPREKLEGAVLQIRDNFVTTGAMTSKQEMANQKNGIHIVGYDFGFLLTALTELGDADAPLVYDKTLSVVDREGSWSEYYMNDRPSGTRCRPWESAINLEALINQALSKK
jgi:hypothetical protein